MLCRLIVILTIGFFVSNGFTLFDKEEILLVPSAGFRINSTHWSLYIQGWYYEEDPVQALILEKLIEPIVKQDLVYERLVLVTADGLKRKTLCVEKFSNEICRSTNDKGQIEINFQVTHDEVRNLTSNNESVNKIAYTIIDQKKNRRSRGEIFLCESNGLTVISDIDDTIKITGVTSTTETLINTFSGEFKSVPGMSNAYRTWQNKYNATFAYVTASPDQLYPFLRSFMDKENFPQGSAHMRHFTWFDQNFISFFSSSNSFQDKLISIKKFLNSTINRKFVLVGDIFQKDPEIYAEIFAEFPDRILKIFIRKFESDVDGQKRLENLFVNVTRSKWATFENGNQLPSELNFN